MNGTFQVLIETLQLLEFAMTEVAFKAITVPGIRSSDHLDIIKARKCKHWLSDHISSVELLDHVIDFVAIQT